MKKRICLALGALVIAMSIFSPMLVWAEPESENPGGSTEPPVTEPTEPVTPSKPETKPEKPKNNSNKNNNKNNNNKNSSQDNKNNQSENSTQQENTTTPEQEPAQQSSIEEGVASIIFTHDMHSHLDSETIVKNGKNTWQGGFARMATAFKTISPDYKNDSFVLDGGDFSMGTAYQTIFEGYAAELRMMAYLGYDAFTLGNHEFDYRSKGLANMLKNAVSENKAGDKLPLPKLVIGNIDWDKTLAEEELAQDGQNLQNAFKTYGAEESYTVIEKNNVRIAVFGIFGKESDEYAPESGTYFKDQINTAKEIVKTIKASEKDIDMIVCLSHSGTSEDGEESEDELLAEAVPDINLIISGHSHTELKKPLKVGNTVIASCGSYTHNVGYVTFKKDASGSYSLDTYRLIPLDSSVEEDADTLSELAYYRGIADSKYFSKYGYSLDTVLTRSKIIFTDINEFASKQGEDTLGNLLADSYIYAIKKAEGKNYEEVDVAVVPSGIVRASLPLGNITVADAFNVLSLGTGADGTPGYPLVSMYLTGKELKSLAEVDATVSDMMPEARLYISGMSYTINSSRLILNRAVDIKKGVGDEAVELDNKQLYRVVADLYSCQMLASVKEKSHGLLSIVPKDKDGNMVLNYEDYILKTGKQELKAWYAAAAYLDSMGTVSSKYSKPEGRKILTDSKNLGELLKQPNKVGWLVRLAVIVPVVIILLIIALIFIKRRKRDANMMFSVSDRQKKAIFAPVKKQKNIFAKKNKRWFK